MNTLSELPVMFRKLFPLLAISLSGVAILPISDRVNALTPLTRGEVQQLRNLVQLMPQNKPTRKAKLLDAMIPGDGLSTGRSSLADVRFNDGSLARVGEQAVFQFSPKTRNFTLNNGTVLLLIPPGRGRTNIRTPSAAAAIRGSALFVRYDQATDTTVVGALTNSGIEVTDKDAANSQVLQAGQMMVVVKGKFEKLYNFDLRNFYETSQIVRGLDLTRQSTNVSNNPTLDSVRAETSEALAKQPRVQGQQGAIKNPSFLKISPPPAEPTTDIQAARVENQVEKLSETSQVQSKINPRDRSVPDQNISNSGNDSTNTSNLPVTTPEQDTVTPPKQQDTLTPPKQQDTLTPPVKPPSDALPVKQDPVVPPVKPPSDALPVKQDPIVPPVKQDPVVPPVKQDPVVPPVKPPSDALPVKQDPVVPPVKVDPVVPPVKVDPVVPPVKVDPVVPPVKVDPVVPPVKQDPVVPPVKPPSDALPPPENRPST